MVEGDRNTLVWPCSASVCSGPQCCNRKQDHSQHSPCSRASSHRASQIMQSHRISRWSRQIEIPWSERARRPCNGRPSAAPAHKITLNTGLVHAPPPAEHLKPRATRASSHRASHTMQSYRMSRWSRDIELPWCGRARRPCARDRRAAPANKITFNTPLVHLYQELADRPSHLGVGAAVGESVGDAVGSGVGLNANTKAFRSASVPAPMWTSIGAAPAQSRRRCEQLGQIYA